MKNFLFNPIRSLSSLLFKTISRKFNISFELIKDSPQVLKDLTSFINPRAIENKKYLISRIERFNNFLNKKLNR